MNKERGDLKQINLDAAGIDVGSEFQYVAVPEDRADESIRKFGCYTADIEVMASWLKECRIKCFMACDFVFSVSLDFISLLHFQ